MIYFARIGEDGPIKIGHASNIRERLAFHELKREAEFSLLGVMEGNRKTEREVLCMFANHRAAFRLKDGRKSREMFYPVDRLLSFIDQRCYLPDLGKDVPDRDDKAVKFDRTLADKAAFVCSRRRIPMAEYLSEMCRVRIERDFQKETAGGDEK